jgi:hypothetical protein
LNFHASSDVFWRLISDLGQAQILLDGAQIQLGFAIILTNGDTDDPVKQRLGGTQTQVFVRLTIGAMWEAWRLVEDRFLKRPLGREYLPLLDRSAVDALERLKKREPVPKSSPASANIQRAGQQFCKLRDKCAS